MAGKTQTYSDSVLNVLRGIGISGVSPFVGLFSVLPANDNDPGTELVGSGYARQSVTFGAPTAGTGSYRRIANTNLITYGPATGLNWAAAVGFGIYDLVTVGTLLYYNALVTPRTVLIGDLATFAIGALLVEED